MKQLMFVNQVDENGSLGQRGSHAMEEGAEMQEWPPKLCYREVPLAAEGRPRNCVPEIAFAERLSTE